MTPNEHFLTCLAEECNEVGQRVSKALRFGLGDIEPGFELVNADRIVDELRDLIAVAAILRARGLIGDFYPTPTRVLEKKAKIEKYMAISREQGVLQEEPQP